MKRYTIEEIKEALANTPISLGEWWLIEPYLTEEHFDVVVKDIPNTHAESENKFFDTEDQENDIEIPPTID